nr:MAG TPA: hypothetical protein [Caudoviricetes sp.]
MLAVLRNNWCVYSISLAFVKVNGVFRICETFSFITNFRICEMWIMLGRG